jgi:RNA polymerase sigma-70 factor (ECF subfamily)
VLAERLQGRDWADALPHRSDYDGHDDGHVDAVAGFLIERFRRANDVEALSLLYELAHVRLYAIARQVTRQLGIAIDPEDLVAGFMTRVFVDVRRPLPRVHRFLGLAHTAMRNDARNQLRRDARAWKRMLVWQAMQPPPADPSRVASEREQIVVCARLGVFVLAVVAQCFHALGARDRRTLLLREVDGLSYEQVAAALELPANQVGTVIKRARDRLARRIGKALSAPSSTPPLEPA